MSAPQDQKHVKTGRGRGRGRGTARQASTASTVPLTVTRSNSTASSNSDSTEPGVKYQDSLGPIDETDSTDNLEFVGRPDVRRQDSTNSSAWLIPTDSGDFVLELPAIGETTLPDDQTAMTLPRRAPRSAGTGTARPGSSDPLRRRGLPMPDKPQQADSWETVSYTHLTLPTIYSV